jgi:hypothetical protein
VQIPDLRPIVFIRRWDVAYAKLSRTRPCLLRPWQIVTFIERNCPPYDPALDKTILGVASGRPGPEVVGFGLLAGQGNEHAVEVVRLHLLSRTSSGDRSSAAGWRVCLWRTGLACRGGETDRSRAGDLFLFFLRRRRAQRPSVVPC